LKEILAANHALTIDFPAPSGASSGELATTQVVRSSSFLLALRGHVTRIRRRLADPAARKLRRRRLFTNTNPSPRDETETERNDAVLML
jgi:hypothetical protein